MKNQANTQKYSEQIINKNWTDKSLVENMVWNHLAWFESHGSLFLISVNNFAPTWSHGSHTDKTDTAVRILEPYAKLSWRQY